MGPNYALYIMGDSCVASSTCGIPRNGRRSVSDALAGFWKPISHNGWPCPAFIQGEELSHTAT